MSDPCCYVVNRENILVDVSGSWSRFALENNAPELQEPAPLGRSLFEFIGDRTTSMLYRQVLAQVRTRQRPQAFEIRCDSARIRRFLRIVFSPAPNDGVSIESHTLREETRDVVHLLDPDRVAGNSIIESCSWCERVNAMGAWYEIEEAVQRLHLYDRATLPALSHGICSACADRVMNELERS